MENLDFGLWMTAMGMGTVFLLLIALMLVLQLMGRLDRQPAAATPEPDAADVADEPELAFDPDGLTEDQIAAITIAVVTHARVRRAQAAPVMRAHEPGSHLFASRWVGIGRGFQHQPWSRG